MDILLPLFDGCVTLGKLLNLSEPQLLHWYQGGDNNANLIALLGKLSEKRTCKVLK